VDWNYVIELYRHNPGMCTYIPGLCIVPKIKYEHVYLTSISKMWVDLYSSTGKFLLSICESYIWHMCICRFSVHLWLLLSDCVDK